MESRDRRAYDPKHGTWGNGQAHLMGWVLYNWGYDYNFLKQRFPKQKFGSYNQSMILGETLRADIEHILAYSAEHDEPNTYFLLSAVMAAWMAEHGI